MSIDDVVYGETVIKDNDLATRLYNYLVELENSGQLDSATAAYLHIGHVLNLHIRKEPDDARTHNTEQSDNE